MGKMYNQLGAQDKLECEAILESTDNRQISMTGVFGTSNQLSGASANVRNIQKSSHMNDELSHNLYACSKSSP